MDAAAALAPTSSPTCPSDPGTTGTPAARITDRAWALSLIARIAPGGGPTKTRSLSAQACANSACSERKPYPGWMARAPVRFAAAITFSPSR